MTDYKNVPCPKCGANLDVPIRAQAELNGEEVVVRFRTYYILHKCRETK